MRVSLNGKPITGGGTRDEPPPAFHVLRQIVGLEITGIEIDPQRGGRLLIRLGERNRAVMIGVDIERGPEGATVSLGVDVFTRNAPERFL